MIFLKCEEKLYRKAFQKIFEAILSKKKSFGRITM
ncbi:MAG: hypothetical protein ACJA17_001258 [Polaribacter sp.]|jgi:hypothetical protein